jgi:hypothetical protein
MSVQKLEFNNSFMTLYVASMQKIFEVQGLVFPEHENLQRTLRAVSERHLVTVACFPGADKPSVMGKQYGSFCDSSLFTKQVQRQEEYLNYYMRVDDSFFPISLITDSVEDGNAHAENHHDTALIATDQFGNHYWAAKRGFKSPIKG